MTTILPWLVLIFGNAASFSVEQGRTRSVLRTLTLVDDKGTTVGQCQELVPFPEEGIDKPDEDELEMLYPTQRKFFQFNNGESDDDQNEGKEVVVQIRTTSFGCGKLGHQIWPSCLALCLYLAGMSKSRYSNSKTVLELGAGCGMPSVVCRDVIETVDLVTATDFWMEEGDDFDKDRLVPEPWHGVNLKYNVEDQHRQPQKEDEYEEGVPQVRARVERLDWHHDSNQIIRADLVIGSDIVYYPTDLQPLWNTIEWQLKSGGAQEVLLMSPLTETREGLSAFRQLLQTKSNEGYIIGMEELTLHKQQPKDDNRKNDGEPFLKMSIQKQIGKI